MILTAHGFWALPAFAQLPYTWDAFVLPLDLSLYALATATLMLIGKISMDASGLPVLMGHIMREGFMKSSISKPAYRLAT